MCLKINFSVLLFFAFLTTYSQDKANPEWQRGFGLTHDIDTDSVWFKPVRFYFDNKKCSVLAKDFYYGRYRPTDENKTDTLLNLVLSSDATLRPLYRWILNKTIVIQDGALAEYTGAPARRYAETYPKEFFEYMDTDKSGEKYSDWFNAILYSGFYKTEDFKNPKKIRVAVIKTMTKNCKDCDAKLKKRIVVFANDCFPDE